MLVFNALNSVDNPPTHRELRLVWVVVQKSILEIIQAIADNYDVPFIILVMAGSCIDQLNGYSSGSA
ncbi:MAG: hypothetical protein EZS28_031159 [Streblomastix strix]|uniref:Uncharacterized protein n=1 Tax=Streblomastix strix TaxID=222440 RepID=A0A5J4USW3_9EUKA|nr:MAG: hypothetical protein EZS28_031159 [Streblomastix strix]